MKMVGRRATSSPTIIIALEKKYQHVFVHLNVLTLAAFAARKLHRSSRVAYIEESPKDVSAMQELEAFMNAIPCDESQGFLFVLPSHESYIVMLYWG
jgi:hypothetical protein